MFIFFFISLVLVSSLPDLVLDSTAFVNSVHVSTEYIPPGDCQIIENCVTKSGMRTFLRFTTTVANIGDSDLILGPSENNEKFVYHSCHKHYHFNDWVKYKVLSITDNTTLIDEGKQGFLVIDVIQFDNYTGNKSVSNNPQFINDKLQGISVGWADIYDSHVLCQYVDITDLNHGNYLLEASINPNLIIEESNYQNNKIIVPFVWDGKSTLSNYVTTKSDIRKYVRAFNSISKNINHFFRLFPNEKYCTNPGPCFEGSVFHNLFTILGNANGKFMFRINKRKAYYGTGFWYSEGYLTIKANGCEYNNQLSFIYTYFSSNGVITKTIVANQNSNQAIFLFLYLLDGNVCNTPNEYNQQ